MIVVLLGYAIPALFAAAAFFFVLSLLPSKSVLTQQLEELQARDSFRRDREESPLVTKVLTPGQRTALWRLFAEAGWYTTTPTKFFMRIIAGTCFGALLALLLWKFFHFSPSWLIPVFAVVTFLGAYSPFFTLNQAIEARKTAIQKALPEFLDMIAATVQAGLALNQALGYAVDVAPGPLGEEVKEALAEIRLGRARADALKAAGDRTNQPDFRNALRAMTQAERMGANIANILNDLAQDARHRRLMFVEEMAAKLPVKMVFPMVFFMIPAIFTIIFGAVAANYFAPKP
ncbi:MAG: type II secretion system F family protein [Candidatus Cybelea sp.]